jgi:hypothetical protein
MGSSSATLNAWAWRAIDTASAVAYLVGVAHPHQGRLRG